MKLTVGFQQSIVMIVLIATQEKQEGLNIGVISSQMKIKESYLRKLASKLVKAQLLNSSRNRYSGYTLNKQPSEISLLDIFNAIEGEESFLSYTNTIQKTFSGLQEELVAEKMEEVLVLLNQAEIDYRKKLQTYTLEQLLSNEKGFPFTNWIELNK
ncbi:MAG: Rrf2 family transcriptional regulator [Streptococcaceae bacterium]|jgi:Rrf2 family protein|nr:Rrf2 family transcriptional regulator [Streptococcaceae bacterium]